MGWDLDSNIIGVMTSIHWRYTKWSNSTWLLTFLRRESELLIPSNLYHWDSASLQVWHSTRLFINCKDPSEFPTELGGFDDNRLHDAWFVKQSLANSDIASTIGNVNQWRCWHKREWSPLSLLVPNHLSMADCRNAPGHGNIQHEPWSKLLMLQSTPLWLWF